MSDATLAGNLGDRAALASLIENLSDEDLYKLADVIGVEKMLEMVIGALTERFQAEAAAGQSAVVQWDVIDAGENTHSFVLTVADGAMKGEIGTADEPRMTLGSPVPVFLKFLAGTIDPMQAFMGGQLSLSGDMMFAMSFQSWIRTD